MSDRQMSLTASLMYMYTHSHVNQDMVSMIKKTKMVNAGKEIMHMDDLLLE